ncbi:MAG: hypothetical protein KF866_00400 [Phycisphaeraceae bacterium]|nr:hypothetical protein [Phycisphaeraceae bacterium]MCW5753618.1 hypothetical protein [Phycisphaeraceae bacterium]
MFHRRLLLMAALLVVALTLVSARLGVLTIAKGEAMRSIVESRLIRQTWTPAVRGRILDRKGRLLAVPAPRYDFAVDYPVLTGDWATRRATAFAQRTHAREWAEATPAQRDALVARYLPAYERAVQEMWHVVAEASETPLGVLESRSMAVRRRVERMHEQVVHTRVTRAVAEDQARGRTLTPEREAEIQRRARQPLDVQRTHHVLATAASDRSAFELKSRLGERITIRPGEEFGITNEEDILRFPGLHIVAGEGRTYPLESVVVDVHRSTLPGPLRGQGVVEIEVEGLATHILGWVRRGATREHQQARSTWLADRPDEAERAMHTSGRDRGRYDSDDEVGVWGIEASQEPILRGLRGLIERRLDTGRTTHMPAEAGRDVRLTIDAMLQARVHAAMAPELGLATVQDWHGPATPWMPVGTPLNGAAVVLEIETGDILALVSTPSFTRAQLRDDPSSIFHDVVDAPWVNRAVAKPYPPGSIAKAMIFCSAVSRGVLALDERIVCTGHLLPGRTDDYQCWIWKRYRVTHQEDFGHPLRGDEALMVSCNIFFYTLGRRLGGPGIAEVYHDYGLGETLGLGVGGGEEFAGWTGRRDPPDSPIIIPDAILMGIGQGPVAWTPLHAARAMAVLARYGVDLPPRIVVSPDAPRRQRWVSLDPAAVRMSLAGLRLAVTDQRGTGHHIIMPEGGREPIFTPPPGVQIWGKTGTAQAPHLMVDPDGEGPLEPVIARQGDHSWFVVLVGRDQPRYVIAVLMEYAGSGGKVSGPIVNQIIQALQQEGYF